MLTSDPITQHLIVNTAELNGVHSGFAPWMSVQFGDVVVSEELNAMIDANGTVHMAYWDTVNDDVMILRLYEDQDRDLVFDLMDARRRSRLLLILSIGLLFSANRQSPKEFVV